MEGEFVRILFFVIYFPLFNSKEGNKPLKRLYYAHYQIPSCEPMTCYCSHSILIEQTQPVTTVHIILQQSDKTNLNIMQVLILLAKFKNKMKIPITGSGWMGLTIPLSRPNSNTIQVVLHPNLS